jgi:hypothetical protein
MDERRANIDLAFRNGLKDFEVLPPPDVWNCIDGRLAARAKPQYFMRAAAFLAIAMTLSILAYRWNGKNTANPDNAAMALNEESTSLSSGSKTVIPVSRTRKTGNQAVADMNIISENSSDSAPAVQNDNTVSVIYMPRTNLMLPIKTSSLNTTVHQPSAFIGTITNTLTVDDVNKEYQDYLAETSTEDNSLNSAGRWSITALATPTYYGKISTSNDNLSKEIMASEQPVVSYTGGVALAYKISKRLSIQSGLFYSSIGQELDGINSFSGFQKYDNTKGDHNFEILTTNGTIYTNNADVFLSATNNSDRIITSYTKDVFDPQKASLEYVNSSMKQSFSYLELPVFLRYKLVDKTFGFNLIGGLSYNLLVDNSVYTVIDGDKYMIGSTEGMNMFTVSSSVGMGVEYKFSGKLSLNLEPTFRYYLNTFNNVIGSQFHPYSFGIFSGISYKF